MNNPIVLNLNVFENANISDLVGTVDGAIDLDLGANGQIFYHIVGKYNIIVLHSNAHSNGYMGLHMYGRKYFSIFSDPTFPLALLCPFYGTVLHHTSS